MNKILSGKIIIISFYLVLATIFLYAHFVQVKSFVDEAGGIVVEGLTSKRTGLLPSTLKEIRLQTDWVEMYFRRGRNKAVMITTDNIRHSQDVVSWETGENWVRVKLSDGADLLFHSDLDGRELTLEPTVPDTQPPVKSMEIPLRIIRKVQISSLPERPEILILESDQDKYTAILPRGSFWNTSAGRLKMDCSGSDVPVFRLTTGDWKGTPALEWIIEAEQEGTFLSDGDYKKALVNWQESVRRGWKNRYNSQQKLWVTARGNTVWNDTLAATFLSDSLETGTFTASKEIIQSGMRQEPHSVSWLVSPYMGNIVYHGRAHARDIERMSDAISINPDISTGLVYLLDTGRIDVIEEKISSALNLDDKSLSLQEAVNRMMLLNEAAELNLADKTIVTEVINNLLDNILISQIYWKNNGLWLMDNNSVVDIPLSFQAGYLFQDYGEATGREKYIRIGHQMIVSSVVRADENGFLPQRASFGINAGVITEGLTDPENFYRLVHNLPNWPRHISLAGQLGKGAWVLTGAESFSVQTINNETILIVTFPPGEIHHLALKGNIAYFNAIQMIGRTWKPDPEFQRYYTGWYSDEVSNIVFIKIRHRYRREVIRFIEEKPVIVEPEETTSPDENTDTDKTATIDKEEETEETPRSE